VADFRAGKRAARGAVVGQFDCGRIAGLNWAATGAYSRDVRAATNFRGAEKSRVWLGCRYFMARWRNGSSQGFRHRTTGRRVDRQTFRGLAGESYMSSKKWNDPQLDAAQFAIDRFLIAQQTVSEQMAEIYQSTRDGCATDEDMKRLKILREQYIALSKEVEDVMGRLLARKTNRNEPDQ